MIRPLLTSLICQPGPNGLLGRRGAPSGGTTLTVVFGDGSLNLTLGQPAPPAAFAVTFADGQLTITP